MVKDFVKFIRHAIYVTELGIVSASFFLVYFLAAHFHLFYHADLLPAFLVLRQPWPLETYMRAYWLVLAIWAVLLQVRNDFFLERTQSYYHVFLRHLINGFLFFCFATSGAFILKFDFLSRSFLFIYTSLSVVLLIFVRSAVLSLTCYARSNGGDQKNLLIVGTGQRARKFADLVSRHKELGYRVVGHIDKCADMVGGLVGESEVIGTLDSLPSILKEKVIDQVVFVIPRNWLDQIEKCLHYCETMGVPATLATDFFDMSVASRVAEEMDGFTYLTFQTRHLKEEELLLKRIIDILVSAGALLATLPLLIITSICVKLSSPGPVFFKQVRCGRNGRRFTLFKFRSMNLNAETQLESLKQFNEMSGPVFKMAKDPRVTKIGSFLRKTSLDEFPQLWNVLRGDMSLVGPRPPLPSEVTQYEPWHRRRLSMNPGITCLWQISGRNEIGFEDWMKLDLQYIDRWSLWLDLKIMLMTVKAILSRKGAE